MYDVYREAKGRLSNDQLKDLGFIFTYTPMFGHGISINMEIVSLEFTIEGIDRVFPITAYAARENQPVDIVFSAKFISNLYTKGIIVAISSDIHVRRDEILKRMSKISTSQSFDDDNLDNMLLATEELGSLREELSRLEERVPAKRIFVRGL